jgi:hypothetical protein
MKELLEAQQTKDLFYFFLHSNQAEGLPTLF